MYKFDRNTKNIEEICRDYNSKHLIVDSSYQRRKVWNDEDKVRLIETILLGLVIPEVYFWPADINPENGETTTHIVDGQQRISTIVDFMANEFLLNEKYFLSESMREKYGNKYFIDLDDGTKKDLWGYKIAIVNIDKDCDISTIKNIFYRLNLTNYNLNMQEKRNSEDSVFGDKCEALSMKDFWDKVGVFSANDAKRMKDVEYCCSIYILANEGIADQGRGKKINDYYKDFSKEFDSSKELENNVNEAMDIIQQMTDKVTQVFVSKKIQLYTLFCVAFKMISHNIEMSEDIFKRFKQFVILYNLYDNDVNYGLDEKDDRYEVMNLLRKYKLASSEGVNKFVNRSIRFEILYKICIDNTEDISNKYEKIYKLFSNQITDGFSFQQIDKEIEE